MTRPVNTASVTMATARWVVNLRFEELPEEAVHAARRHILDTLGVMIATGVEGVGVQGRQLAREMGGNPQATVPGLAERVPVTSAALANGMLAHALDFDDSHTGSVTHPSAVVVPATLAVAEWLGASEREAIVAALAGYECNAAIGTACGQELMQRGFHATSVVGAFAATAAAGRLLRLSADELGHALGLVGSQASGILAFLDDGTAAKQLHAGWAAQAGITAALLARSGLTGPARVLEAPFGLLATHLGDTSLLSGIRPPTTSALTVSQIVHKRYPSCHLTHACVDALLAAITDDSFAADEIVSIHALVPEYYRDRILEPESSKLRPRTAYEAKFSMAYCLASAAWQGGLTLDSFRTEALEDPDTLDLAARFTYEFHDFAGDAANYPGAVRVGLRDGRVLEVWRRTNAPLTDAELQDKFLANAVAAVGDEAARDLAGRVLALGAGTDRPVTDLLDPLRVDPPTPSKAGGSHG